MSPFTCFQGRMDKLERGLTGLAGVLMLLALAVPIWHVHLWAPQYPEGMDLWIHARTLSGNLQNINILNHYIGMKPISVEAFTEFVWMAPALGGLGGLILASALAGRREAVPAAWGALFAFNAFMVWDLHRWMYAWGHELDPHAAITIAGFTPPALGFKHIANFYVTSYPSYGGVLVVLATILGGLAAWHAYRSSP
jgi:copper chaperone NosL